jgi:Tol biopolymer transport system component
LLTSAPLPGRAIEPVSAVDVPGAAAGGGGDSGVPILSPDGRYVLFASTAANLAVTTNNHGLEPPTIPVFNVFLRDRVAQTTALVSADLSGVNGGNGSSFPSCLSSNARYAVFESSASDLVYGDTNNASDIFVRDLQTGVTRLVSASTGGIPGNGASRSAAMTPDGRFVAFVSAATNLVPDDTNGIADIFVRDTRNNTTTLVSVGALGTALASSEGPDLTPDGRYVVFYSTATNLIAGVTNTQDIYVRDLKDGVTTWASSGAGIAAAAVFGAGSLASYNQMISADGKFVAYQAARAKGYLYPSIVLRYNLQTGLTDVVHTNAACETAVGGFDQYNLDMTPDGQRIAFVASTNGSSGATTCILVWDATTAGCTLVSGNASGKVVTNANCDWPTMDRTGRYVAFGSNAGLTPNTVAGAWQLYRRDLTSGALALVSADTNGAGAGVWSQTQPMLAENGQYVAFECEDGAIFANDRNRALDVVVRDIAAGTNDLVSAHAPTLASMTANGPSLLSANCSSADGRFVVFATDADNFALNDTNASRDVYVHDRIAGTNVLVSVNTNGVAGNGISYEPAISTDGRFVVFTSQANDLVPKDTNRYSDVFLRDLQTRTTTLISVNKTGIGSGNTNAYAATVGAGGRFVLFRSRANNLTNGTFSGENVFVRDTQTKTTAALTTSGALNATMSADGRFVIYSGGAFYVWNTELGRRTYTNNLGSVTNVAISADGGAVAGWGNGTLFVTNFGSGMGARLYTSPAARCGLRFSADKRFLTFASVVSKTNRVYVYDLAGATNYLVSHAYGVTNGANASADGPDISGDGRFIAYRGTASDIVPGDTNTFSKVFLFDRQTGGTTLLTASYFRNAAGNNRSGWPFFSADGQTVYFQTSASDVAPGDYNQVLDAVAYAIGGSGDIPVFFASVMPSAPGQAPWITWPVVQGRNYRVQFKTALADPWQELHGTVHTEGDQGYCQDVTPGITQRFYRVVAE